MANAGFIIQPPKNEEELNEIIELVSKISNLDQFVMMKADGQKIEIPSIVTKILYEIITILSKGGALTIIPMEKELTTQQSADILNISRPFLVNLLENGEIPFHKTGTHRKIYMKDLMAYKERNNNNRANKIAEIIKLTQEYDLYD